MIYAAICPALSAALTKLKEIVAKNEEKGVKTVIFCEDRLTLAAERTVCAAVGGTFSSSVYTLARFLAQETGKNKNVLSGQGSAMAVRKIIEEHKSELSLFKKLSSQSAAETVYDTIALLYSSRVSYEDAAKAAESGGILGGKLKDISIIYSAYQKYLEKSGKQDRNAYMRQLPAVIENSVKIKGNCVVFLGFQAFTCTSGECVRSAFLAAESVHGLFIGGREEFYVNEAPAFFIGAAKEFGGAQISEEKGFLCEEAEVFRKSLFNADSYYKNPFPTSKVCIFEAADFEEELEFIAASIKKHVIGGERYAKISVMLPDLEAGERTLSRVFSRYKIPYYSDRQRSLSEHPLCGFLISYLSCAVSGCRFADADAVISSPFFPALREEKDVFRNYLLRLGNFRGGIKRMPKDEALKAFGFDRETVLKLRETFLNGLGYLNIKGGNSAICRGVRSLLKDFKIEDKLKDTAEAFKDERPSVSAFQSRIFEGVSSVLTEAESIAGDVPLKEFIKILKSGFSAMKVSLIPPKADAVFVGDICATANTGSNVVFAANLLENVPSNSADTALLTDREIAALESVNLNISPKIRQVNARKKEVCALNLCAFRENLYLTYTAGEDGADGVSEIVSYAEAVFAAKSNNNLAPINMQRLEKSGRAVPYFCSERLPAARHLRKYYNFREAPSVYQVLKNHGYESNAAAAVSVPVKEDITCGKQLYLGKYSSLSPTTLETYFSCPYLSYVRQGLKIKEREQGAVRAADAGNFIHSVLQDLAEEINGIKDIEILKARAREIAEGKLKTPPYSSLADSKSGEYVGSELLNETVKVSEGMFEQLKNSSFKVSNAEKSGEIKLSDGVKIYGRIDRVDESGETVRVIDYKTGNIDPSATKYYTGAKLQLPLYLLAVSGGKRPAGAYYFPASVEYREKEDGVFRLKGFMDGSDDIVLMSDSGVKTGEKSGYVDAYYQGKKVESAMSAEDFPYFLEYSRLISDNAVKEMSLGNISPSPAKDTCKYCPAGGSCGMALGRDKEERKTPSVKCSDIAEVVRRAKEGKDESHF